MVINSGKILRFYEELVVECAERRRQEEEQRKKEAEEAEPATADKPEDSAQGETIA